MNENERAKMPYNPCCVRCEPVPLEGGGIDVGFRGLCSPRSGRVVTRRCGLLITAGRAIPASQCCHTFHPYLTPSTSLQYLSVKIGGHLATLPIRNGSHFAILLVEMAIEEVTESFPLFIH